jgi:hypothetical protein
MKYISTCRWSLRLLLVFIFSVSAQLARADSILFTGNLTSDGAAVGSGDPVIINPSTINLGDPFAVAVTYNPSSFTQPTSNSYLLTNASLTLAFDGYSFLYTSAGGNFIEFATPGAFGAGTASFLVCSSAVACTTTDFMNLYFTGSVTNLGTLASQVGGLTGDPSASPSQFEFLRNFSDGSQTDLQGTLGTSTATPEPATLALFAAGLAGIGVLRRRRRIKSWTQQQDHVTARFIAGIRHSTKIAREGETAMTNRLGLLLFAILLVSAPSAFAVDGVILINQNTSVASIPGCPHAGFPIVICQSGSYRLTGNLTVPDANTDGVDINADNVTLDLNGFTIAGPVTCTGQPRQPVTSCTPASTGIGVSSSKMNASVFNGSVQGFQYGILFSNNIGVSRSRVEEVNASQNSIFGIFVNGAVRHCNAGSNGNGIVAESATDNIADFNAREGIEAEFASGNIAIGNGGDGLFVDVEGIANLNVLAGNGQDLELAGNPLAISSGNNNCSGRAC